MAKGRNRNNQTGNRPEDIEESTDAEFLQNDDQVDVDLKDEEEQAIMANEPSKQDDDDIEVAEEAQDNSKTAVNGGPDQDTITSDAEKAKKKGSNAVWYGVGVVLVAAAVAGIYYSNQSDESSNDPTVVSQSAEETEAVPAEATASEELTSDSFIEDESATDLASSDDVVEHQTGKEIAEDEHTPDATADDSESSSVDERPAEQSAAVTPELGIGAFEQEELATGEKEPEDVTSMDQPNVDRVDGSEIEEVENDALNDTTSESEATSTERDVMSEEAADAALNPETQQEEDISDTQEAEATSQSQETETEAEAGAVDGAAEDYVQQQQQVQAQAIAAVEEQGSQVIAELEREFEVLAARQQQEIRRLQQELSSMQQHLQDTNASADGLLLNDVSRLLQSAENELRFNGNVANAVSILTVAQRIAAESKNTMLDGLVGAIGADIVTLRSSESATVEDMFRQVQQLSRLIDLAPLNTPDYSSHSHLMMPTKSAAESSESAEPAPPESKEVTTNADARWYERTWSQTKSLASTAYGAIASDLGELVRVEKLSEPDSGLLSAEQAGIMRNNLKMQLGFAQQALMSRQQGIWQTSLASVAESLQQYFRQDSSEAMQAQSMLADLVKASVQPTMPDISHSRRALSETYEQLRVQRSFQE